MSSSRQTESRMGRDQHQRPIRTIEVRQAPPAAASAPPNDAASAKVYQRVIEYEEAEAKRRPAEKDAALFYDTCESLRKLFKSIDQHKTDNANADPEEIGAIRDKASVLIVTLKKLNRLEKIRTKIGRDALHKEKQKLDSMHLLLQNLLYEAKHLDKEATKCLQFKSKDEEIDLVPVEEFYETAPKDVSRPSVTQTDEHQLRLARLEWELRQRRELAEACSQLEENAQKVSSALSEAQSRLGGLAPKLRDALNAAEPLQEALGLHVSKNAKAMQEPATLLPPPLFLLHARTLAFSEAFEQYSVQVSITGDENEARQLQQTSALPTFSDSDSDPDSKEDEDNHNKKKRHRRNASKLSKEERAQERIKLVLKMHPLKVNVIVKQKTTSIILTFSYLMNLKIVTIKSSIEVSKPVPGVSSGDVLNSDNILHALYPNDDGNDSPHPATAYILKSSGIDGDFSRFIPELGSPFIWAQRMCGLDFMTLTVQEPQEKAPNTGLVPPDAKLSSATVENVIIELQRHLKKRLNLMVELQELESGNLPPFEGTGTSPVRLMGSLTQWQAISWAEYNGAASTANFISLGLVSQIDMFYRAIITRQSAKLVALVALKSNYPKQAPIFSLTLHWNGTHRANNNDDIRDIERCVNTEWGSEENKRISLAGQITKLIACLDILLEAMGSSEFPPDKVMFTPVRGRTRTKPYKFLKQGSGIFIQY